MTDIKHLISPFVLVPSSDASIAKKASPRQAPPCNCDSDEENNFGMAPECAFVCNGFAASSLGKNKNKNKNKSKSRGKGKSKDQTRDINHAKTRTKRNKP
jgi:hypothetical protein